MYLICFKNNRYDFPEQNLPIVVCNGDIASRPVKISGATSPLIRTLS